MQLTQVLALEWAQYNIRVNAIGPGFIYTSLSAVRHDNPEFKRRLLPTIPLRRVGQPEEVSPLALYFASDASSYVTGQTLFVDAGMVAKGPYEIDWSPSQ
jgi:NAD(P)-dependent dehydrogenase (short-subunit alcohol dehydrogenase family)